MRTTEVYKRAAKKAFWRIDISVNYIMSVKYLSLYWPCILSVF